MIAIIDYGAGNIKSLQFALEKLGKKTIIATEPNVLNKATSIILPGVGAFRDAIKALRDVGFVEAIQQAAEAGKPILGICLGMQLFYEKSFEDGEWEGIGLLKGTVNRIPDEVKVPHMGWNTLTKHKDVALLNGIDNEAYVYFVHSYAVGGNYESDTLIASTNYAGTVPAIVQKENIIGMQFHPEKSGTTGIQLLKNFKELIR